jgi:hypothetical protein
VDIPAAVIAVFSFGALWRFNVNSAWLTGFGALVGVALSLFR